MKRLSDDVCLSFTTWICVDKRDLTEKYTPNLLLYVSHLPHSKTVNIVAWCVCFANQDLIEFIEGQWLFTEH